MDVTPDRDLDCSGLICPLPVLRARKALSTMAPGEVLRLVATDPAAPRDLEAFCAATGHALVRAATEGEVFTAFIRRA